LAGDVDITWMTEPDAAGLAGNPDFEALAGTRTGMDFIHFNLEPERSPLLGDIRVRHALAYGLDRENLVDAIYSGYAEVAETLIPQPLWSSNPEGVTVRYPYDPEQAMALLEEAGWTVGSDGIREKDGQRLALVMLKYIDSTSDLLFSIAQENWRLIGVELTPDGREPAGIDEAYYQGFDFETVFMGTLWFSGSGFGSFEWVAACDMYPDGGNRVMYCNEEFDALLEQVATTFDEEERVELFTQMQNIFLEDMSLLPVAHHQRVFGTNKRTHNVVMGQEIATYYANTWWVEA
jgi:peptide/nickel transport system substrate-binding protein